jgi:cell fate regulator YaaT (PSP1 superfamily)
MGTIKVIEVKLRDAGKISYYAAAEIAVSSGDFVILESDRGLDYGQVLSSDEVLLESDMLQEPLRKILRIATPSDIEKIERNRQKIAEITKTCAKKIQEHKLNMKLIDAELSFDSSKIIFYFTAEERIDFRELVKELAKIFKARIEMKQVGVRDEVRRFGGFGQCGRRLCCATFIKDFEPVTIKMAKDQNLPLNPAKISGTCGRLMCCLSYEHKNYKELAKGLPKIGQRLKTKEGQGKVVDVNFLKRTSIVELEDGRQIKIDYNIEEKK